MAIEHSGLQNKQFTGSGGTARLPTVSPLMASTMYVVLWLLAVYTSMSTAQDEKFELPSYVDVCFRDDPKVAECLREDMEKLIPKFKSGSKDFELAPLDPMVFRHLVFDYKSAVLGGHLELPDIIMTGLSTLKVMRVKPQLDVPQKLVLDFDGHVPVLKFRGSYNLTGNVITLPVNIDGVIDIVFEQVDMAYKVEADAKAIGDHEFLDLKAFKFRFLGDGIKSAYITNNDVVRGSPTLNRIVTTVLNNFWRVIMKNLLPATFPVTDTLTTDLFKSFFKKYPYDILFPKSKTALKSRR